MSFKVFVLNQCSGKEPGRLPRLNPGFLSLSFLFFGLLAMTGFVISAIRFGLRLESVTMLSFLSTNFLGISVGYGVILSVTIGSSPDVGSFEISGRVALVGTGILVWSFPFLEIGIASLMNDDPGVVTRGTLLGNIPGCTELGFPFPELGLGIPIAVSDLHLYTVTHFSFPMPGVISGRVGVLNVLAYLGCPIEFLFSIEGGFKVTGFGVGKAGGLFKKAQLKIDMNLIQRRAG